MCFVKNVWLLDLIYQITVNNKQIEVNYQIDSKMDENKIIQIRLIVEIKTNIFLPFNEISYIS